MQNLSKKITRLSISAIFNYRGYSHNATRVCTTLLEHFLFHKIIQYVLDTTSMVRTL